MKNSLQNKLDTIINENSKNLNAEISSKLHQAREKAIAQKKFRFPTFAIVPLAASLVLAVYFLFPLMQSKSITAQEDLMVIQQLDSIEVIEDLEDLDVLDDMEFYQWLSEEDAQI